MCVGQILIEIQIQFGAFDLFAVTAALLSPVCFRELGPETKELTVRLLERDGKRERKAFLFRGLITIYCCLPPFQKLISRNVEPSGLKRTAGRLAALCLRFSDE